MSFSCTTTHMGGTKQTIDCTDRLLESRLDENTNDIKAINQIKIVFQWLWTLYFLTV